MERVCGEFQVGASGLKIYQGDVLIDEDHLYMQVGMNINTTLVAGFLGGAIGSGIAWTLSQRPGSSPHPFETSFAELPSELRARPGWGCVANAARIVVLPKGATTKVSFSIWTGCTIRVEGTKFILRPSVFRIGKVRRLLRQYGWI